MNTHASRERRAQRIAFSDAEQAATARNSPPVPETKQRLPAFPDVWLFDSEKLLRELARCREMMLLVPTATEATYFALQIAIDANWNLEQKLRYQLHLHRQGQRAFAKKADSLGHHDTPSGKRARKAITAPNAPARTGNGQRVYHANRARHPRAA